MGRTLIVVPCWWDRKLSSLAATVREKRPELLFEYGTLKSTAIPSSPPPGFFPSVSIPGVGELMLALHTSSSTTDDISGWWMGEKFDGIRGCWNPHAKVMYSRTGRLLKMMQCVYRNMPKKYLFLDGELWAGRGNYSEVGKMPKVCKTNSNIQWMFIRFIAFDNPSPVDSNTNFETRYKMLLAALRHSSAFILLAPRLVCQNKICIFIDITSMLCIPTSFDHYHLCTNMHNM